MKIALAGNPNSGKTTLFNAITGKIESVGNWPGVTVEKIEARLKPRYYKEKLGTVVDLPGAYSITPYTGEEVVTRDFINNEKPDVIINIIDASSLERSLFFTTQLLEFNVPVIMALNKQDLVRKHGVVISIEEMSKVLHCPIIEITAKDNLGLDKLIEEVRQSAGKNKQKAKIIKNDDLHKEDQLRQIYVKELVNKVIKKRKDTSKITTSDKVDRIVAHPIFGIGIFYIIMLGVYSFSINGLGGWLSGYFNDTLFGEIIPRVSNGFFERLEVAPFLQSLIVDGALAGVGAVIGFLPLIMVLFFCLALLEDSGYMARVAVVMDKYFKKIGLSGKSIIPMIVGSGCAIPGVMATRTIEDINEKRITTILTPFVPCSAKLPIITLFSVVFFPNAIWVGPSMYIIAFAMIAIGGILLRKLFAFESTSTFIIELPEYKIPSIKHAFKQMFRQAKGFIYKATTIILVMNTVVWFMQAYGWNLRLVEDQGSSILASLGGIIAPLLIPIGLLGWQLAAATITGFIAKENVVATFAVLLAVTSEDALHVPGGTLSQLFTPVTAYGFLVFNLFTPPCFAAIGAMNAELGSKKWLFRALGFQLAVGYTLAMIIAQFGTLIVYGEFALGFVPAMILLILIVLFLIIKLTRTKRLSLAS